MSFNLQRRKASLYLPQVCFSFLFGFFLIRTFCRSCYNCCVDNHQKWCERERWRGGGREREISFIVDVLITVVSGGEVEYLPSKLFDLMSLQPNNNKNNYISWLCCRGRLDCSAAGLRFLSALVSLFFNELPSKVINFHLASVGQLRLRLDSTPTFGVFTKRRKIFWDWNQT